MKLTKENINPFIQEHIKKFKFNYECKVGGWPDTENLQIESVKEIDPSTYQTTIWFNEIVPKACSCISDAQENYENRIEFQIKFDQEDQFSVEHLG